MLSATDPLPARPQRVLVAGTSGSGKTTLAAVLAERLRIRHVEIDALFHGPDWTPRTSFVAEVQAFAGAAQWVTEWQYGSVRDLLADRADLLVWLDLARPVVMRQVTRRTLSRRFRRTELWNGNIEPPLRSILTDPEHIIRWAWSTHGLARPRVLTVQARRPELTVVRLGSHAETTRWLAGPLSDVAPG